MASLFASTVNTRPILPDSFRFVRSDAPCGITPEEIQWLMDHNVYMAVDLRTEAEQAKKPCPLKMHPAFTYHTRPLTGGGNIPATPAEVVEIFLGMKDDKLSAAVDTILSALTGVIYYCNLGKDRTSVVTATLLHRLGFSREYILADYLRSVDNLKLRLESFAAANPGAELSVITPRREYMEAYLDTL